MILKMELKGYDASNELKKELQKIIENGVVNYENNINNLNQRTIVKRFKSFSQESGTR